MKLSYMGIGQWCATFACTGVSEGRMVKLSGSGTAAECAAGDRFAGCAASVARSGDACSVVLGGIVTVPYSGDDPAPGWATLSADGAGGVRADPAGQSYLVVEVNTADKTAAFVL